MNTKEKLIKKINIVLNEFNTTQLLAILDAMKRLGKNKST